MAEADTNRIPVNLKLLTRFFSKIKIDPNVTWNGTPCWLWTASTDKNGYTRFFFLAQCRAAHIVSYWLFVGATPKGLELDHLCRRRHCVNPTHLDAVTHYVNVVERGIGLSAINAKKTHCKRGHEFTPENTIPYRGNRLCRTCSVAHDQSRHKPPKTHCRRGHLYSDDATRNGKHRCRICSRDAKRRQRLKGAT